MSSETSQARWPARLRRRWRIVLTVAAALLVVGAFLLWGPIGLGNGPLSGAVYDVTSNVDSGGEVVGFTIPMQNTGGAPAVIDGIDLISGTRYPAPHILALRVLTSGNCGGTWPARQRPSGFVLAGCGGADHGPLIGHAFGTNPVRIFSGWPAAAEVAAPRPHTCWVISEIVVHYHVGIRHYAATGPFGLVECGRDAARLENRATNAVVNAS
jgi:hypothetical protein